MIKNNQQQIVKEIYQKITSYKKVSIFPHFNPDNDAYGASLAMAIFLRSLNIDARIIGMNSVTNPTVIKQMDTKYHNDDDNFCNDSLAIIVDLGTKKNIIDLAMFEKCKASIRIDHHIKTEQFCDLEWVDIDYCSTCEMIGWFILFNNEQAMNKAICDALYPGILTDSGCFMFPSASSSIFELVAIFFNYHFDKQKKQDQLLLKNWNDVNINTKIIKHIKVVDNEIAYLVITPSLKRKYHLVDNDSKVYLMNNILDFKVWFSIYYSDQRKQWKVSIRSRNLNVNKIAQEFNGGGHKLASGFCINAKSEIKLIIDKIKQLIKQNA